MSGASQGRTDSWGYLVGAVGLLAALLSIAFAVYAAGR